MDETEMKAFELLAKTIPNISRKYKNHIRCSHPFENCIKEIMDEIMFLWGDPETFVTAHSDEPVESF